MSSLSTHILDTSTGRPASGVPVRIEAAERSGEALASASTDADGRIKDWGVAEFPAGAYRLVFDTAAYLTTTGQTAFFPDVTIHFVMEEGQHYHVPLLLSPYGYSTYRGS